uniref:endo-polygalacturonase n=1 Tax=Mycena chlorophos TaxID=658473 RepID=A0ABQ0M0T3_MYCCL|nr:polygalacturonase [Mycena chlorophos]
MSGRSLSGPSSYARQRTAKCHRAVRPRCVSARSALAGRRVANLPSYLVLQRPHTSNDNVKSLVNKINGIPRHVASPNTKTSIAKLAKTKILVLARVAASTNSGYKAQATCKTDVYYSPRTEMLPLLALVSLAVSAFALPNNGTLGSRTDTAKRATCTVNSVSSAANLGSCTDVLITGFTVPSGETVTIAAASGATVTMSGDIVFSKTTASGPLLTFDTDNINFNGGDRNINGNGALYWDGEGTGGGVTKPHPFVKLKGYGTFKDVTVLNSPAQAISVGTTSTTVIESVTVDNSAGNAGSLGHNTDGFDISASDLTLSKVTVNNQDDCTAINSGSNIVVEDSTCIGSHGLSIGSIASGKTVSNVKFARNTVTGGLYGLRIKVDSDATGASVSDVTYEANTVSGITEYGVLITQSYPDNDGTPGTGAPISGISFTGGTTSVSVGSSAYTLVVDCGACSGTWDFSDLDASGGKGHIIASNKATISGGTY